MNLKLLIIEDEAAILNALVSFFTGQGYAVDTAREKAAAEALLASRRYDAVLADLRLGGGDSTQGLDLVSFVQAVSPETRVLLLTAYGSPEIEREARRRGAHAFLHKPLPLATIAAEVRALLAGR